MRIISGKFGGLKIHPPTKMPYTRPTTDLAKEGLFNILQHRIDFEGIKTLDLFGGTGNISYELASRGAADLTLIEKDSRMFDFIQKNLSSLGIENAKVLKMNVFDFLKNTDDEFDLIFAGPPYALEKIDLLPEIIVEKKLISSDGFFVLEHTPRNDYKNFAGYQFQRNYGTTIFSFFTQKSKD